MAAPEQVILTNMCMVYDGSRILVLDRCKPDWPGITFPGGHVEPGESFVRSVIREIKEETGLDVSELQLCGMKQFTQRDGSYRFVVLFYKTNVFSGKLISSREGRVFWIELSELRNYALADGFDEMLEIFESESLSENYWFYDGQWNCVNL